MVKAGYRMIEGSEPEIILSVDEGNQEYAVVIHVCAESLSGINCVTAPVDPREVLRIAKEIKGLEARDYAPATPETALNHAASIAREKLEDLKREHSCNERPKGGPN